MARHTNRLLQFLLTNEEAKKKFIELMGELGTAKGLYNYFEENKFYGTKYYVSGQTISGIIRKLGFKGRRGRPGTSDYHKNKPRFEFRSNA